MRFVTFLHYPGFAVANGVAPRVASGQAGSSEVGTFGATLRYLVIFQAALIAPIVVWAEPIVDLLLGKGYEESADVLRALAPSSSSRASHPSFRSRSTISERRGGGYRSRLRRCLSISA